MIKIIDLQIWPTTKMIHKLWESHKWFIEINHRNETQNDYSQKWSQKNDSNSKFLLTMIIHMNDSQKSFTKIIHKNDWQKWFTKMIHKSDWQKDCQKWFTKLI